MPAQQKTHQHPQTVNVDKEKKRARPARPQVNIQQMMEAPGTLRAEDVLAAQQQLGNQVVQRALEKKDLRNQVTDGEGNLVPEISSQIQQKRGGGSPLPDSVQKDAAGKFGRDFKHVRIHTDDNADKLSRAINARAFTVGSDIFFKGGVFSPGTAAGRETLVHELTHVVQQSKGRGSSGALKLGAPDTALEKEADQMGKRHGRTIPGPAAAPIHTHSAGSVDRALNSTGLPDELKSGIEGLSGLDMQHVKVHTASQGSAPANALAYTQGSDIHASSAQDQHLPHEAWHIAQQAQGRVQARLDDAPVQMQEEEEEIQAQPEEEELQMQPDAAGVVQRDGDDEDWDTSDAPGPKKETDKPFSQEQFKAMGSQLTEMMGLKKKPAPALNRLPAGVKFQKPNAPADPDAVQTELKQVLKARAARAGGAGSPPEAQGPAAQPAAVPAPAARRPLPPVPSRIPEAPPLPAPKAAAEKPTGFAAEIASKSKAMHTNKQREKLAALEAGQQKKFGERESKLYGEEQGIGSKIKSKVKGFFTKKNLAGLASKAGSGLKSLAGMAGSKLSGMLGDKAGEAKDHFLGKSKDKEEGGKASGGGGGGGGGSAIGTIMEKYAEVVEENKKLKAELEKLKPKKEVAEN